MKIIFSHSFSLLQNLSKFHIELWYFICKLLLEKHMKVDCLKNQVTVHTRSVWFQWRIQEFSKPNVDWNATEFGHHSVDWKLRFHLVSQNYYSDSEEESKIDAARRQVVLTFLGQVISPPTIIHPRLSMLKMLHFLSILSPDWFLMVQNSAIWCRDSKDFQEYTSIEDGDFIHAVLQGRKWISMIK